MYLDHATYYHYPSSTQERGDIHGRSPSTIVLSTSSEASRVLTTGLGRSIETSKAYMDSLAIEAERILTELRHGRQAKSSERGWE